MLRRFDGWLIEKLEKRLHAFQRWSGIDCITLDRWLNLLVALTMAIEIVYLLQRIWVEPWYVRSALLLCALSWFLAFCNCLRWFFFESAYEDLRRLALEYGLRNTRKVSTSSFASRVALLLSTPFTLAVTCLLWYAGQHEVIGLYFLASGLHEYVKACDPLPPCRGKVREWIDALGTAKLEPVGSER